MLELRHRSIGRQFLLAKVWTGCPLLDAWYRGGVGYHSCTRPVWITTLRGYQYHSLGSVSIVEPSCLLRAWSDFPPSMGGSAVSAIVPEGTPCWFYPTNVLRCSESGTSIWLTSLVPTLFRPSGHGQLGNFTHLYRANSCSRLEETTRPVVRREIYSTSRATPNLCL